MLSRRIRISPELVFRCVLAVLALVLALLLPWTWLREAMTGAVVTVGRALDLDVKRVDATVASAGTLQFGVKVQCTLIHVYFLSVPLLWYRNRTLRWNLCFQLGVCLALLVAALGRILLIVGAYSSGIPWDAAHGVICALVEFAVMVFIVERQPWDRTSRPLLPSASRADEVTVTPDVLQNAAVENTGGRDRSAVRAV